MTHLKKLVVFSTLSAVTLLLAACAFYEPLRPLRVVAPETFGLTCVVNDICVEDTSTIAEATQLSEPDRVYRRAKSLGDKS